MIKTHLISDNADSCNGDSGGPIVSYNFFNSDLRLVQTGIVSFGPKDCGSKPGVYTKITSHLKWILDHAQ
jgi:transmembrane serine protease 9